MNKHQLCPTCQGVTAARVYENHISFSHLHQFGLDEPDEFLLFHYYLCTQCEQIWEESNSTYNNDHGWHWRQTAWHEICRKYRDHLPPKATQTAGTFLTWARQQSIPFDFSPPFRL